MAITSIDIQNQSFAIDRKGYDVDEVDVFLEQVADEIDALNIRVAELEEALAQAEEAAAAAAAEEDTTWAAHAAVSDADAELAAQLAEAQKLADEQAGIIEDLEEALEDARADGKAIAQALIVAQRSADDILAEANAHADGIIADAQDQAAAIIAEAEDDRRKVEEAIDALEEERAGVRSNYQAVLKDFIADATDKLAVLNREEHVAVSAHARVAETREPAANQVPVRTEQAYVEPAYTVPADQPVVVAATVTPTAIEKDFSGFGELDDGFEFDEID